MNAIDRSLYRDTRSDQRAIDLENRFSAPNYAPLPVVLTRGEDSYLWDTAGKRYVDMMSAYSAVSLGHAHPRILAALTAQANRLAVPSRAYYSDRLGPFLEEICRLTGLDAVVPMNTGAEAVETAVKAARRWGYRVKGIAKDKAEIIVAAGNFHGRTTTVTSFSTEPDYRDGFGPFTPGFKAVPFGDLDAVERAITPDTAAVLMEPIQGEAGIIVPPDGFLKGLRRLCDEHNVLLILDEVQSGLGRTGKWFAYQHEGIRPDGLILGKALGGGVLPVSAFVGTRELMNVFTPGSHGSTFGGNPLAATVGLEALLRDPRRAARGEEPHRRRLHDGAPARDQEPGAAGRAWPRPVGRRRDQSGDRDRARGVRAAVGKWRALEGDAPHHRASCASADHCARRPRLRARPLRGGRA